MGDAASAVVLGALEASQLQEDELSFFRAESPAGITLFARNIAQADHEQSAALTALTSQLQSLRQPGTPPMIIAIDQEGGRVARLKAPFPDQGPALELAGGGCEPAALASLRAYGLEVGLALKGLGVNVNFAPVVDVLTEPQNIAIGDRVFAREPVAVSQRAGAYLQGLQQSGVWGCLKHFPGQGAATIDTHLGAAIIERTRQELAACELIPFQALMPQVQLLMLSHCIYPQLDAEREASLSPLVIEQLLRQQLGYQGLVLSDDMTMGAIVERAGSWSDAIIAGVESGNDLLLICRGLELWQQALAVLRQSSKESPAFRRRLQQAAERVGRFRAGLRH